MTAFLTLAWRKVSGAAAAKEEISSPPDVTAVPSTDTHLSDNSLSTDHMVNAKKDGSITTRQQQDTFRREQGGQTNMHVSDTVFRTTISLPSSSTSLTNNRSNQPPGTPEGLRPRQAVHRLRQELNFQPFSNKSSNSAVGRSHALALSSSSSSVSFYGSCSPSQRVAESPNLSIGRVRTAVGALVAAAGEEHACNGTVSSNSDIDRNSQVTDKYSTKPMSVLPPRNWMNEREDHDHIGIKSENGDNFYTVGAPLVTSEEEHDDDRGFDYQRLNDSLECWTPSRARRAFMSDDDNNTMESADASSIHASPATIDDWKPYSNSQYYSDQDMYLQRREGYTRTQKQYQQYQQHQQRQEQGSDDKSYSSGIGLVEDNAMQTQEAYNFEPIIICHDMKDFKTSDSENHMANVSGISLSTAPQPEILGEDSRDDYSKQEDYQFYSSPIREEGIDGAIIRKKGNSQAAHKKEQLILELVQRLQGDEQVVKDIMGDQNGKKALHGEGLLSGYTSAKRQAMIRKLENILMEMENTQQEEYFMSPTHIPTFSEAHTGLRKALMFVLSILRTAIRISEPNKISFGGGGKSSKGWTIESPSMNERRRYHSGSTFWLRKNLRIEDKESHACTPRGGDTSVFSLPSDETATTPHTSNVSMNSSITSKRSYEASSPCRRETLKLLQTFVNTVTILQKLTLACDKLANENPKEFIAATEEIKSTYFELMMLSKPDLAALLKACLPEANQFHISRVISDDVDQGAHLALPPPVPRQHSTAAFVNTRKVSANNATDASLSNMFSPTSDDMNSETRTNDFEVLHCSDAMDLKKRVVSFDYQDELNREEYQREQPPVQSCL